MGRRFRFLADTEPQFRLLLFGQGITAIGDRMAVVALPFAVLAITRSASALGIVLACGTVATLVCLLGGGVISDRVSRRNVMIGADLVRAASQSVAAVLVISGAAEVWNLAVTQAVGGAAAAFFVPASQGLIPDTVSRERLQRANALVGLSRNVTGIGAPALAGVLVTAVGPGWALAADASTFAVSAALLARLSVPARTRAASSIAEDLREGWAEFSKRVWVWASVVNFAFFQMIVLASWFVLGPYVSELELGGASAWAAILVASSVGAILGGLLALRWTPVRTGVTMFAMVTLSGPQLGLLAIPAPVAAIAAGALVASAGLGMFNALWFTALQDRIPPHARSRVSSYDWIGSMIFLPVGMALIGPVSNAVGVTTTLALAGAWAVAASAFMIAIPSIRSMRVDDPPTAEMLGDLERAPSS